MVRLLLAVGLLCGCDAPHELWNAATRNSRYRATLDQAITSTDEAIARLEERRRLLQEGLGGVPKHHIADAVATADVDLATLRTHRRELRREAAELAGDIPARRRRCPVHGNWMYREVVATESSDTAGPGIVARRLEQWKYPHHGGPATYSNTHYLPLNRLWICRACQEARASWQPKLERHDRGSFPATDTDLNLIEAIATVEARRLRNNCRASLEYGPIEAPFHLAASFTVLPSGAMTDPSFVGSEHALNTGLQSCLYSLIDGVHVHHRPAEPVEIVRLPMWTEL